MVESGEVDAVASGHASARGSACSTERRAAELLDTVAWRGDDGGRVYVGGAAVAASAMAGEGEGERRGEWMCPGVQGGDGEVVQRVQR